ncbi:MAG: hypothetical protein K2X28_03500 [Alphaproteobacteria bacterium]|nr:hypothetical protein [Alphaproteobacteria bacterium]
MRNKFLKMAFMALCLSTSSALHAMNEEEAASCSSATTPYAGKYEIRRNDPSEKLSGSVAIRQDGDHLVLENFSLIPGSYYYNRMEEVIRDTNESSPFERENRQIANFVLSAFPTEVIQLKFLGNPEGSMQYGAELPFGGAERAPMHVRFRTEKSSFFGEMFTLSVESPYGIGMPAASPIEQFRLFKIGSAEHDSLSRLSGSFSAPKSSYENYWNKDFLPKMGDSFREYNRAALSNDAILKALFPGLREGEIPDRERAKAKFSELAKAGRPYAKLFMPPEE